jgi:membrane-associated protein
VWSMTLLGWGLASVYPQITKQIDKLALLIIFLSLLPGIIGYLRNRQRNGKNAPVAS